MTEGEIQAEVEELASELAKQMKSEGGLLALSRTLLKATTVLQKSPHDS